MRIEIRPGGGIDHIALSEAVERAVEVSLKGGAMLIANDVKTSIARGPKTGRVYRRRSVAHQASAPGQPPATDTGKLVGSVVSDGVGMAAYVEVRSIYAKWLEYGTRRMAPRPFLIPAVERNRQRIGDLVRGAVATATAQFRTKAGR